MGFGNIGRQGNGDNGLLISDRVDILLVSVGLLQIKKKYSQIYTWWLFVNVVFVFETRASDIFVTRLRYVLFTHTRTSNLPSSLSLIAT